MFKLKVTPLRAVAWFALTIAYWFLINLAWIDTRFFVHKWGSVFASLLARKKWGVIMQNIGATESEAWVKITEAGPVPGFYFIVAALVGLVLVIVPFVVRRDSEEPIWGLITLPLAVILSYLYSSLLNLMLGAGLLGALHYKEQLMPGSDFFLFLIHPLYLLLPTAFPSLTGFFSQLVYIAYTVSVLTTPNRHDYDDDDDERSEETDEERTPDNYSEEEEVFDEEDEDGRNRYVLELDRLCRLIQTRTRVPSLSFRIKNDVTEYIFDDPRFLSDVRSGMPQYRMILTETAKSIHRMLKEQPGAPGAVEAFTFVCDELEKMEYITQSDAELMRKWIKMSSASK